MREAVEDSKEDRLLKGNMNVVTVRDRAVSEHSEVKG